MFWTAGARYRSGNPKDYIKWDGRRWTLNGMQPKCYFQNMADTPLPPQSGWGSAEMPVTAMPTLTFGSVRVRAQGLYETNAAIIFHQDTRNLLSAIYVPPGPIVLYSLYV